MEEEEDTEEDEDDLNNQQLAELLQRMEIMNRTKELEHAQLLRDAELANVRQGVAMKPTGRADTGLYGLRENNLVENRRKRRQRERGKGKGKIQYHLRICLVTTRVHLPRLC